MSPRLKAELEKATRAASRSTWPIKLFKLRDDANDDLSDSTTPGERVSMMWPLACEAWLVAGRTLPTYTRADMPSRLIRKGEPIPDDDDAG